MSYPQYEHTLEMWPRLRITWTCILDVVMVWTRLCTMSKNERFEDACSGYGHEVDTFLEHIQEC